MHLQHVGTIQQGAAARTCRLEADERDRIPAVGEELFEVVRHATPGCHTGTSDDDCRLRAPRDPLGPVRGLVLLEEGHLEQRAVATEFRANIRSPLRDRCPVEAQRCKGHRAVDEDGNTREASGLRKASEVIEEDLGAIDGERRDDEYSATVNRPPDECSEALRGVLRIVRAIAVGGLHEDEVRLAHRIRLPQHGVVRPPEVAAESHRDAIGQFAERRGAPQDVARDIEAEAEGVRDLEGLTEIHRFETPQRRKRLVLGVERKRRPVLAGTDAVREFRPLLVQPTAVGQHDPHKRSRIGSAVHGAVEAKAHKAWQVAAVVEVSMCNHDSVEARWVHGERCPVPLAQFLEALEDAAVHQYPTTAGLEQVAASGNGSGTAEDGERCGLSRCHGCHPPR
ncbi:unannotated protein [freshwater metagenome]|uniref:Unannotated protein n=1 Tax=freshwater metagenome TaxID=449393 RepID=A0A6J7USU8_9ZZZZ